MELTLEKVLSYLSKRYSLNFVDWNDNLNESLESAQKAIA
jgi:hypothetical protein